MSCSFEQILPLGLMQDSSVHQLLELLRELFEGQPVRGKCKTHRGRKGERESKSEVTEVEAGSLVSSNKGKQ